MRELKDFEKDLNMCSKCGLCESACPLFKINPNDCVASKGKFIMLHGVTKGDLQMSRNIKKYLDLCLFCGKCKSFCPSGIDVCQILACAKNDNNPIVKFLQSRKVFNTFINFGKFVSKPFRPRRRKVNYSHRVLYFKGCVNEILPQNDICLHKIFRDRIEIVEPDFDCCGLPFLTSGNIERFTQAAIHNLSKFSGDFDYIVTDCASCENTLLQYPKYVDNADLSGYKFINWGELVVAKRLKFKYKKPVKVTFHKPCHLNNDEFFEKIIENCKNVEYVKSENYDSCCGFAGSFALKNPKLASELTKKKAQSIVDSGADCVVTTCPSCIAGLKLGLMQVNSSIKVMSLLEFLAQGKNL